MKITECCCRETCIQIPRYGSLSCETNVEVRTSSAQYLPVTLIWKHIQGMLKQNMIS